MKKICLLLLILSHPIHLFGQKPTISFNAIQHWLNVGYEAISNDGQYVLYLKYPADQTSQTLIIKKIKGTWQKDISNAAHPVFTDNSQLVIFMKGEDSLCLLKLQNGHTSYISHVLSFSLLTKGKKEYLAYIVENSSKKTLNIIDLIANSSWSFFDVSNYYYSKNTNMLLLQRETRNADSIKQFLSYAIFPNEEEHKIWEGYSATDFVFDNSGSQMAFTATAKLDGHVYQTIWYYKQGNSEAVQLVGHTINSIFNKFRIDGIERFSNDGHRLFFKIKQPEIPKTNINAAKVDIWSYIDPKLQFIQLQELSGSGHFSGGGPKSYTTVIDISTQKIIRLQQENETIYSWLTNNRPDEFSFIRFREGDPTEIRWNRLSQETYYVVSTLTGERKKINLKAAELTGLSPSGKFLVFKDSDWNYYSYEISTEKTRILNKLIPFPLLPDSTDVAAGLIRFYSDLVGWIKNDDQVLLTDQYDIWLLDLLNNKPPINITNGYGRRNNIALRPIKFDAIAPIISVNEPILLSTFNKFTKDEGYAWVKAQKNIAPAIMTMTAHHYPKNPVKAQRATMYLVTRERANESPNIFATTDFTNFIPLSDTYPEQDYNWLTTELITFTTLDGKKEQGLLYKPENFDSLRKYPVILHFYGNLSDELNAYKRPAASFGRINIPWFVSRGYIVASPDIHTTKGKPGIDAYNSVLGIANHLAKLSYIDSTKMAIHGHSHGGYENNYIVTQTHKFAAALTSAGTSDLISGYGFPGRQNTHEVGQYNIGGSLWEKPDLYLEQSPVLYANKINTPLLLLHNKLDGAVPFQQGVELFTALRRLGKRVWLLQYDDENHVLYGENSLKDYTIRITQYFDHYLKSQPAPEWMTRGIPAKFKGTDDGLKLDLEIKTPGNGLLFDTSEQKDHD